jgi:hypothetical protein
MENNFIIKKLINTRLFLDQENILKIWRLLRFNKKLQNNGIYIINKKTKKRKNKFYKFQ